MDPGCSSHAPSLKIPSLAVSSFFSICRIIEDALSRNTSYYCSGPSGCGKTHALYHYYSHPKVCFANATLQNREQLVRKLAAFTGEVEMYNVFTWFLRNNAVIVIDDAASMDREIIPVLCSLMDEGVSVVLVDEDFIKDLVGSEKELSSRVGYRWIAGINIQDVYKTVKSVYKKVDTILVESIASFSIPSMRRLVILLQCMQEICCEDHQSELSFEVLDRARTRLIEYDITV